MNFADIQRQLLDAIRSDFSETDRAKMVSELATALGVRNTTVDTRRELTLSEKEAILRDLAGKLGIPVATKVEFDANVAQIRDRIGNAQTELNAARELLTRLTA
jgi:hypothetical protein